MFQRILLSSDGTMTNLLEEISRESLCARKFFEDVGAADFDIPELELCAGQLLWRRTVTLQGNLSGINYLYAESLIAPGKLDEKFSDMLLKTKAPIGKMWDLFQVETYKSLVEWGEEPAGNTAKYFSISEDEALLFRTYRVFSRGKPVMRITEKFPRNWFRNVQFSPKDLFGEKLSAIN
ncbi:chorismate--pyruvate lyase family protein [Microbulbifer sp.]|uniref:chorismate--pyruvate lyase family protein n=1 Tax=Microbulbifer sp. TaxID=1908541 RepID=UPI003F3885AD